MATRRQQHDVLADVLRPQLHQLRRLPDGPERAAELPAVDRQRQRHQLGRAMSRITNSTPRSERSPGGGPASSPAGSAGHVAYVERVVSPTRSSCPRTAGTATSPGRGSPARQRLAERLRPLQRRTPGNTARPTVTGTAKVGSTLTRLRAPGAPAPTLTYQWLADRVAIAGAPALVPSHRPRSARRSRCRSPASHARLRRASQPYLGRDRRRPARAC